MTTTRALAAGLGAWLAPVLTSAQVFVGSEFQVNTYTTNDQTFPSLATDADGNFLVAWQSTLQDGSATGIYGRRFLASGEPAQPSDFRVNAYAPNAQSNPMTASDPTGRRVVVWQSNGQDGSGLGIYARRFDPDGAPGPEFRVNTTTTDSQQYPSVAMDASGNFVVAWMGVGADGSSHGIVGQRYTAVGDPDEGEFVVNAYTVGTQGDPSVAVAPAGDFVVIWNSVGQDGSNAGIFGQRFDRFGLALAGEFRVNAVTTGNQLQSVVGMGNDGSFVVVWLSPDGDSYGVFGRRFDPNGEPLGGDFRVNTYTTSSQIRPAVAVDAAGNAAVAWGSFLEDSFSPGVYMRLFDRSGRPHGDPFRVNSYTTADQDAPTVAAVGSGEFVVAWHSNGQDGSAFGIRAQRLRADVIFRDGFES
jgi:hypothetical protein